MARVVIVGAGVAGLLAAQDLRGAGHDVVVLDKGHVVGGRLATRRVGPATFDTGAQFVTARGVRFGDALAAWCADGVARPWFLGSPDRHAPSTPDEHVRFRGAPTMRALATALADDLPVRSATVVDHLGVLDGQVVVGVHRRDDPTARSEVTGDALLLTPPVPQVRALLDASALPVAPHVRAALDRIAFDPCLAVLAVPDGPTALPTHGAVRDADGDVVWCTDNLVTGASATPAVTLHASAASSHALWDASDTEVARAVVAAARPLLGVDAVGVHVHRWRFAAPTTSPDADALLDTTAGVPVAFAGDGLTGGRLEGAATSGWAAAALLRDALAADADRQSVSVGTPGAG